ncbi:MULTISPECIES: flagellin [unclassified Rhizobium]|uniref:flagellin N-terminal helical domain-containing protein n=1 Tax=unclassified Rhizobium TaxID=2613769 RepID=UPI0015FEDA10|nr:MULTISPECIES: flagellin [unclassified Rhizobium]MBB1248759.1 flagellin [Rhizobium sp. G21]MCV3766246.1 flagellin [Rhizobium sp. TRM95796]
MSSIVTNTSAMAALNTLRSINSSMEDTQNAVSTGYSVDTAKDNAAYWSIATTMRSDKTAMSTVQDALGLAAAKTDTAYTGLNASIEVVNEIKAKLVAAREPGVDKDKINSELTELKSQLSSISESASFSGENWLYNNDSTANATVDMVGSFVRDSSGSVSVGLISYDTGESTLIDNKTTANGILTAANFTSYATGTTTATGSYFLIATDDSSVTQGGTEITLSSSTADYQIDNMISVVDDMLDQMIDAAATLGATNSRIDMQDEFVADLMDTIDSGVGKLVDADMNEESTKLKALQTQQQLAIQSLSIANSNSDSILQLFR